MQFSRAQHPLVKQWDSRFGGILGDKLSCFHPASDGGFILGGFSKSGVGGDKTTAAQGNWDYWLVKTDAAGNKIWDKTFGGTGDDELYSLCQTRDQGYLLGGFSRSGVSGDKTQNNRDSTGNTADYWILKTDSLGNLEWDKVFGGTGSDMLFTLQQTRDGGYLLGGLSYSGINGDKTQPALDTSSLTSDYWLVKTDSLGNALWDRVYGGFQEDRLTALQQTRDGGFLLGGYSRSQAGGDKSQANWDSSGNSSDYWVLKTDSSGNKLWDKNFGGTLDDQLASLQQTQDGGSILAGISISGAGGDKTQASQGNRDFWMVKLDSAGMKQWDRDYGGTGNDDLMGNVFQT